MAITRLRPFVTCRGSEAVAAHGMKSIWFNGELFATCCDLSDLPISLAPWREVSDQEALTLPPEPASRTWLVI